MKNMHINCRCRINEPSKDSLSYYLSIMGCDVYCGLIKTKTLKIIYSRFCHILHYISLLTSHIIYVYMFKLKTLQQKS